MTSVGGEGEITPCSNNLLVTVGQIFDVFLALIKSSKPFDERCCILDKTLERTYTSDHARKLRSDYSKDHAITQFVLHLVCFLIHYSLYLMNRINLMPLHGVEPMFVENYI